MDEITGVMTEDFYVHNTLDGENAKLQSHIENVAAALAGLSFILNFFIIVTVVDVKLKTHLKFVLSLAFSDLFLAFFLVVARFIRFPSPWIPFLDLTLYAELPYNITANTTDLHFSIDTSNRLIPMYDGIPDAVKDLFIWEPRLDTTNNGTFMSNETEAFNYEDTMEFLQKVLDSIRPSGFNGTERFRIENRVSDSTLSIVLACAYLIPNITSVLTMLFITVGLLVSVVRPLHYRTILSKRRGTVLVLTIWGFSLLCGVVVFVSSMNKDLFELSIKVFDAQLFIWYGVAACFLTISIMYVIILIGIRRQITKQSTRALANKKAAITAIAVIGSFAVFNLPVMWGFIFSPLNVDVKMLSVNFETILELLFIANTILDPIIYAVRLGEVATGVTKIKTKFQMFCTSKHDK